MPNRTPAPQAPIEPLGDTHLVARMAERDEAALTALYARHAPTLLALARRILSAEADAEDVVQETFVQVWRQAARYDPGRSSVTSWLVLIARSRAIDRLRGRRVAERVVVEAGLADPSPDTSLAGERNVFFAERGARIRRALQALPAEQREVIELSFFRGLTQNEIALRTGTPLGTVKTRTLLAMKKLRTTLRADLEDLL